MKTLPIGIPNESDAKHHGRPNADRDGRVLAWRCLVCRHFSPSTKEGQFQGKGYVAETFPNLEFCICCCLWKDRNHLRDCFAKASNFKVHLGKPFRRAHRNSRD